MIILKLKSKTLGSSGHYTEIVYDFFLNKDLTNPLLTEYSKEYVYFSMFF